MQQLDKSGHLPRAGGTGPYVAINEQTYALTGLIAYYEAIRAMSRYPGVRQGSHPDIIRQGYCFHHDIAFGTTTHGGFFDRYDVHPAASVATKSYNSDRVPGHVGVPRSDAHCRRALAT